MTTPTLLTAFNDPFMDFIDDDICAVLNMR